jgi:hypothetical protein
MGSFITNLHVRGADHESIVAALQSLRATPAYLSAGRDDAWISVFPDGVDQDAMALQKLGTELSRRLQQPVIAFLVHDSDIFVYLLFDKGEELDRYDSAPGYFSGEDLKPSGGAIDVLMRYCSKATSVEQLTRLLHQKARDTGQSSAGTVGVPQAMKDALLKKLRDSYPMMKKQQPNLPSLEEMLAQAEKRFADLPPPLHPAKFAAKSFVFAEDMAKEFAGHLGIPQAQVADSYRYLANGEGLTEALLLVDSNGVRPISLAINGT